MIVLAISKDRLLTNIVVLYFTVIMLAYINFLPTKMLLLFSYLLLLLFIFISHTRIYTLLLFLIISIYFVGMNFLLSYDAVASLKLYAMYVLPLYALLIFLEGLQDDTVRFSIQQIITRLLKIYAFFVFLALIGLAFGESVPNSFIEDGLPMKRVSFLGFNLDQVIYGAWPFFRVGGVTHNPNTFGMFGAVLFMVSFTFNNIRSNTLIVLQFIAFFGVILSFSRASILSLVVFYLVYLLFTHRFKKLFILVFLISLITIILIIATKNSEMGVRLSLSLNKRDQVWSSLWDYFLANLSFGIGLGGASNWILIDEPIKYPHNFHLTMLVELGLIGTVILYAVILYFIVIGVRGYFIRGVKHYYAVYLAFCCAFMMSQFFENFLFSNIVISAIFYLLVATALRLQRGL